MSLDRTRCSQIPSIKRRFQMRGFNPHSPRHAQKNANIDFYQHLPRTRSHFSTGQLPFIAHSLSLTERTSYIPSPMAKMLREIDQGASKVGRLIAANPLVISSAISGATIALYPDLTLGTLLEPLGFTADGVVAGNPHVYLPHSNHTADSGRGGGYRQSCRVGAIGARKCRRWQDFRFLPEYRQRGDRDIDGCGGHGCCGRHCVPDGGCYEEGGRQQGGGGGGGACPRLRGGVSQRALVQPASSSCCCF
ncbi:hypothetical protein BZA05DRAFT_115607 [Tricharina praecox]|uniref:uncharacterized protein n=1 Tax=Tricharina praecox TaxID=43433 RepID=UPI00221E7840|nr:uncharacterized protein BZA05DRAFT_115607 [Tricharina praecox]KAI5858111.1 hypothetical protein BZA05DRAFT_115607 [Tricharina praecox]